MPEFMLALRQKVTIYFGNLSSKVTTGHIEVKLHSLRCFNFESFSS